MINRASYYHFIFLFLSLTTLPFVKVNAQVVTVDSVEVVADEEQENEDEESYYPDTLRSSYRSIIYDTLLAISLDKGFYYKRYMDSLLRAYQLRLRKTEEKIRRDSLLRDSLIRAGKIRPDQDGRTITIDGRGIFSSTLGILFLIVALGLFAFIVARLFLSNSQFFSRNRKNITADLTVSPEENESDFDRLLRNAIKNGDYRLAVRYLYLQSLELLAQRKFIEINANKTNYEYVSELRKHKFASEFALLTLQYEYIWYGEYPIDVSLFEVIQGGFSRFNKMIR